MVLKQQSQTSRIRSLGSRTPPSVSEQNFHMIRTPAPGWGPLPWKFLVSGILKSRLAVAGKGMLRFLSDLHHLEQVRSRTDGGLGSAILNCRVIAGRSVSAAGCHLPEKSLFSNHWCNPSPIMVLTGSSSSVRIRTVAESDIRTSPHWGSLESAAVIQRCSLRAGV